MSGAVGAMCLHLSVASRIERRVLGGDGKYLNMSLSGCPEFTSRFLLIKGRGDLGDEGSPSSFDDIVKYVGFVSQLKVEYRAASPNMARGNGC